MNTAVVNTVATEVKWRKLNDKEKAAYGPHSMVVGFAECCPYCRTKNLRVVSDTENPDSPFVYIENHEAQHQDGKEERYLCPVSESFVDDINRWMRGEVHNRITIHVAKMPYAEFAATHFPDTVP